MPAIITLSDLFTDTLKDIYYAEKKILKALPKMAKSLEKGSSLAAAFEKHREQTEGQVERLEKVFKIIGKPAKGKKCEAIEGLSKEADELMEAVECTDTLEAGLLAGAQAVEHYEIARYGTLVEWAKLLGHEDAADLLQETLDEEKQTDELLNDMATSAINDKALEAEDRRTSAKDQKSTPRRAA